MFTDTTFRRRAVLPLCGALAAVMLAPLAFGAAPAHAADVPQDQTGCATDPLGPATPFNVFVLGDATQQNADTQGRLAIGGNATLTNYDVGLTLGSSVGNALVVGGALTYTNG